MNIVIVNYDEAHKGCPRCGWYTMAMIIPLHWKIILWCDNCGQRFVINRRERCENSATDETWAFMREQKLKRDPDLEKFGFYESEGMVRA